jgi:SagB-type dehydrogenase family enzyme
LLSALRSHTSESSQQYQYPSAGSLYPVQTYVYIKPDRVDGELAGLYYYHPHHHELIQVSQNSAWPGAVYGINQPIFEQAAFGIFLIAQMAAIEPIYGQRSRDFCLLEAGYMGQLLMQQAATCDLGLCPIGDLDFAEIAADFQLSEQQQLLHSFVGGIVNPQPVVVTANPQQQKLMWLQTKLKEGLRKQLPSYMVPQHFILLDEIPLSANGKVDLKALPLPQFATSDRPFIAPKTQPEQALATIWQTTLRLEEAISIDDNFFDRGGNSLSMMQIISQIQQQFQIEMPIATFFNQLTIREQAVWLATQLRLQASSPPGEDVLNLAVTDIDALSEAELDALLGQLGTEVES